MFSFTEERIYMSQDQKKNGLSMSWRSWQQVLVRALRTGESLRDVIKDIHESRVAAAREMKALGITHIEIEESDRIKRLRDEYERAGLTLA
jgi:hypothetical protein